jgi:hypothetical protein
MRRLPLVLLSAVATPALADTRSEVDALLRTMQAAVLAADREAYLACVDTRDPEFATEQRHWADDLARHVPREFRLELRDDPDIAADDPVFADDTAQVTLRATYLSTTGHAASGTGKSASWRADLARLDPDGAGPLPARWLYAGEHWLRMEGTYPTSDPAKPGAFVVKYFPGSEAAARDVLAAFPGAKTHADDELGVTVTRPLQIKLYQSMEHLKAWVYLSMPDEILGGWNEPGESIKFMDSYTRGEDRWRAALAHEYGHAATWELGPSPKALPWWMAEGIAELSAEHFTKSADRIHRLMLRLADRGQLCTWDEISDYDKAEQRVKRMAYNQGQHLMAFVTSTHGKPARNAWIAAVASATPLDDATRSALKISFDELDKAWRASLTPEQPQKAQTPPAGN